MRLDSVPFRAEWQFSEGMSPDLVDWNAPGLAPARSRTGSDSGRAKQSLYNWP